MNPGPLVIYLFTNFSGIIKSKEQLWSPQFKHTAECLKGLSLPRLLYIVELHSQKNKIKKGCQSKTPFSSCGRVCIPKPLINNRLITDTQMGKETQCGLWKSIFIRITVLSGPEGKKNKIDSFPLAHATRVFFWISSLYQVRIYLSNNI